jgi:hypothetical protein
LITFHNFFQGKLSSKDLLADYFSDQKQKQRNKVVLLHGNIHQGSAVFQENAGKQCTCNCCTFLIHAFQCDLENLSPHLLDNLLQDGNRLYQKLSKIHHQDYLMVKELEGIILFNSQYYKLSIVHEWSGLTASSFDFYDAINTLTKIINMHSFCLEVVAMLHIQLLFILNGIMFIFLILTVDMYRDTLHLQDQLLL